MKTGKAARASHALALVCCLLISALPSAAQAADSVVGMCLDAGKTPEVCDCAAAALREDLGAADYAVYEQVGVIYLEEMAQGLGRADAWMKAIDAENVALTTTNEYGKAHRDAMKACSVQ